MSKPHLKQMISVDSEVDDEAFQKLLNHDPILQEICKTLHQFPFIIASWRIYDTSDPKNRENDSDFSIYINELKNSFDSKCVDVLE